MDQIAQIRREKHLRYLKTVWFPDFKKACNTYFNNDKIYYSIIQDYFRNRYLNDNIQNLTKDEINNIPASYRKRIKLTSENLVNNNSQDKEEKVTKFVQSKKIKSYIHENDQDSDINDIIDQSRFEYDKIYSQVLLTSLSSNTNTDSQDELNDLIQIAIAESLYNEFWVCIDLRVYGPDPSLQIYVNESEYFLTEQQQKSIKKIWKIIDPESQSGMKYNQNMEYFKGLAQDIKN